jgi:hypothetical protein
MAERLETTHSVLRKLSDGMRAITAYPDVNMPGGFRSMEYARDRFRFQGYIDGTSFFPAGIGLWREKSPAAAPEFFPESPLMILAHNWGAVHEFETAHINATDPMNSPSWECLLEYLDAARVGTSRCFFTNIFIGLQPDRSLGTIRASKEFKKQCREFLVQQIEIVKPCVVATLGQASARQYQLSKCETPSVALVHPSYVRRHYKKDERKNIVAGEAAKLAEKLDIVRPRWLGVAFPDGTLSGTTSVSVKHLEHETCI